MYKSKKYSCEILKPLVEKAFSVSEVARQLGIPLQGGSHTHLSRIIKKYKLDTSHFTGQAHMKGKKSAKRKSAKEILKTGYERRECPIRLKRAMTECGVKYECVKCKIGDTYNNLAIVLEIDHINNDWTDNRLENLQFICPNCHSQKTKTDRSREKFIKQLKKVPTIKVKVTTPRKNSRPPKETLENLIWTGPSSLICKQFNVSDTMLAKWCKFYNISKPPRGYWAKRHMGQSHEEALDKLVPMAGTALHSVAGNTV